jgi:thiol:disulfide interchange protein DsbD
MAGACLLVALWSGVALAQKPANDDPFNSPQAPAKGDPFDTATAPAQKDLAPPVKHLKLEASVWPKSAKPGETVKVTITGTVAPGYHTYPITQRTAEGSVTTISYEPSQDFQPIWNPFTETSPKFEKAQDDSIQSVVEGEFVWSQDILIRPEARPGPRTLKINVKGQVCNDRGCDPFTNPLEVTVDVTPSPAAAITPSLAERLKQGGLQIKIVSPPPEFFGTSGQPAPDRSLLGLIVVSMLAALAMLATPCVFPMIPITVSFFLKQAEKKNHNAPLTAAVYSLTIIIVLAAAVLLLGGAIVRWANSAWLNFGLGAVLVFFALSLFGMYEIELPSGLARFTAAHEGKGGYIGAFFMALTFTITSFTCTGPFLGPLLVAVKEYQLTTAERALGALAYSATFAAPFFVLALFPSLLKSLPKSGGWLNAVKVVMGFLELAAALKFLANMDLVLNPGNPILFNYETVLCAWIALSIACGLYLLGVYRLPHDTPLEHLGVARMLLAAVFFGLTVYMVPALWRVTPQGVVGQWVVAFLPLDVKPNEADLHWERDYEKAYAEAVQQNKLIFIDFTGVNCTNCRANEKNVFTRPEVRRELKNFVLAQLYTDSVPNPDLSAAESARQAERNLSWLRETFADVTNPFYAIIKPQQGKPAVADGRLTGAAPGRTRKGFIPPGQVPDFEQFLSDPQKQVAGRRETQASQQAALAVQPQSR